MSRVTLAGVAESADATVSNTVGGNPVRVQVSSPAPLTDRPMAPVVPATIGLENTVRPHARMRAQSPGAPMTHLRMRAALLAAAFVASVGWSSPALAAPAALAPDVPLAPASTTVPFAATSTDPVAPGVQRRHGRWTTSAGPQVVELIDVDPDAPGIGLEVSGPAAGPNALETVRRQAARASRDGHRVIAAINGDTFGAVDAKTRAPAGLQVHRGEVITGSRTTKPTLGFDADEHARLGDVSLRTSMTLADGVTKLTIDRVNKPRQSGDLVLYTRRWGTSTHTPTGGSEVVLTGAVLPLRVSGTWTATVASVKPTGHDTTIPTGALVLSAQGTDAAKLAGLAPGSTVTIATSITAGWEGTVEAIGGREWLPRGGGQKVPARLPAGAPAEPP